MSRRAVIKRAKIERCRWLAWKEKYVSSGNYTSIIPLGDFPTCWTWRDLSRCCKIIVTEPKTVKFSEVSDIETWG